MSWLAVRSPRSGQRDPRQFFKLCLELPKSGEVAAELNDGGNGLAVAFVLLDLIHRADGGIDCVAAMVGL